MLSIIVAKSKNNVIGKNNELPWKIPEDLKRFKNLTTGHNIIMGRKTFESLGRILPNRIHIVLTQDMNYFADNEFVKIVHGINDLEEYINSEEENFVIGGGKIYELLLPYAKKIYLTEINAEIDGDTFFPKMNMDEWNMVSKTSCKDNNFEYDFINYERK